MILKNYYRFWDTAANCYAIQGKSGQYIVWTKGYAQHKSMDYLFKHPKIYIAEQCIGQTDINNKLAYENDIIKDKDNNLYYIKWINPHSCFGLFKKDNNFKYIDKANWLNEFEIIGNKHEEIHN